MKFFCDEKAWRTCRSRRGRAARKISSSIGESDINLIQKVCYNGHYGLNRFIVQQMLQADGIKMAFQDSIRRHQSVLLHHSGVISMMYFLRTGVEDRNEKSGTDKAHPRNDHISLQCANSELAATTPENRIAAKELISENKVSRLAT